MSYLVKINYPELLNSEYPLVVNRIINIIEEHNPALLHLTTAFERLAAFRPQLDRIEAQERSDADSALLQSLDNERDKLLRGIRAVAEAFSTMPLENIRTPAAGIVHLFDKHGTRIARENYTAETQCVYNLMADVKEQPGLVEALDVLALTLPVQRLEAVNTEFDRVFMHRHQHQAETPRVNIREIRNECDKAITRLWSAIDYNISEHGEEVYQPLLSSVNNLNSYYRQQLSARATRRKNAKDANNEEPVTPIDN